MKRLLRKILYGKRMVFSNLPRSSKYDRENANLRQLQRDVEMVMPFLQDERRFTCFPIKFLENSLRCRNYFSDYHVDR